MRKLYNILLATIAIFSIFTTVSIAETVKPKCGVNERCKKDGYYCVGAIGQSASGVCVPNALNITMCRAIDFVQKDIFKYFILFASIFAGLYMFIGKFAIVTLAQIITGIAVLVGAPVIIANVIESDQICNVKSAKSCLLEGIKTTKGPHKNNNTVRNLSPMKDDYTDEECGLLGCVKAKCEKYKSQEVFKTLADGKTELQGRKCTKEGTPIWETKNVKHSIGSATTFIVKPRSGQCSLSPSFEITCTTVPAKFPRDYFICNNDCNKATFAAEAPSNQNIESCKDLIQKNVQYK